MHRIVFIIRDLIFGIFGNLRTIIPLAMSFIIASLVCGIFAQHSVFANFQIIGIAPGSVRLVTFIGVMVCFFVAIRDGIEKHFPRQDRKE